MNRSTIFGLAILFLIIFILWFFPVINYIQVNQMDIRALDAQAVRSLNSSNIKTKDKIGEDGDEEIDLSTSDKDEKKPRIVVTLTTIPSRINRLRPTIKSLMEQEMQADEIALNLPWKTLKGDEYVIPEWLSSCKHVKIYRIEEDLGPATKLLPTLKREHPETKILVVDDDYFYPKKHIYRLVKQSEAYPDDAITAYSKNLVRRGKKNERSPTGGHLWSFIRSQNSRTSDIVLGCFGFLVKPRFFTEQIFDYSDAPDELLWVDDIWFSGNLLLNKIKIRSPPFESKAIPFPIIAQLKTDGLIRSKNASGHNDNTAISYFWSKGLWQKPGQPGLESFE